jgi:hypothetical protein
MDIYRESLEDEITDIVQGELCELGIMSCEKHNPREMCNGIARQVLHQMNALVQAIYEGVSSPVKDEFGRTYHFKTKNKKIIRVMESPPRKGEC